MSNIEESGRKSVQNPTKKKKRSIGTILRRCIGLFLILAGLCFYLYPVVSEFFFNLRSAAAIEDFEESFAGTDGTSETADGEEETVYAVSGQTEETGREQDELYQACFAYNCRIYAASQSGLCDVESYESFDPDGDILEYLTNDLFGYIEIPAMDVILPLYLGASTENMAAGAAVLGETSAPIGGLNTNAVISAHRGYRGSPYFREIEMLEIGDAVYVTNPWETMTYIVSEIDIIDPSDAQAVKIQEDRDMITLLTCHPYRSGGKYRYVVYCDRLVEGEETEADETKETTRTAVIPAVGAEADDYIIASDGTAYESSVEDIRTEQLLRRVSGIFLLILFFFFFVRLWIYRFLEWRRKRRRELEKYMDEEEEETE